MSDEMKKRWNDILFKKEQKDKVAAHQEEERKAAERKIQDDRDQLEHSFESRIREFRIKLEEANHYLAGGGFALALRTPPATREDFLPSVEVSLRIAGKDHGKLTLSIHRDGTVSISPRTKSHRDTTEFAALTADTFQTIVTDWIEQAATSGPSSGSVE